ncbi:MAG: DUF6326 family protein [Anaeromyxobacter sp.]
MDSAKPPSTARPLVDSRIPVRLRLSALWAAVTLCYLYGDFFGLFAPGRLQSMLDGRMGPLGQATQGVLAGTALMMAIPSTMVFLTLALPAPVARWANVVFGLTFTLIMLATMPGAWAFYVLLGVIEVALTLAVVGYAWTWPREGG